ncbi:MAG TPA: hypothetical protein VF017_19175 [Thermoanaerobaculia bacterium]|nr:hypothetical protein [Thermoanaerobaculia bacterium]
MSQKEPNDQAPEPGKRSDDLGLLREFTGGISRYTESFRQQALEAARRAEDEQTMAMVDSSTQALQVQMERLVTFTLTRAARLAPAQQQELNELVRHQAGVELLRSTTATMERGMKAGWISKFLRWLAKHFQEVKKILRAILEWIFGLFGAALPRWIDALLNLADELKNAILGLIEELLGGDSDRLARQLSAQEVQWFDELAAVARLGRAYTSGGSSEAEA